MTSCFRAYKRQEKENKMNVKCRDDSYTTNDKKADKQE